MTKIFAVWRECPFNDEPSTLLSVWTSQELAKAEVLRYIDDPKSPRAIVGGVGVIYIEEIHLNKRYVS